MERGSARFMPGVVFETSRRNPDVIPPQAVTENAAAVLASCLPRSGETHPELARVTQTWHTLPAHIRAAILALVDTSNGHSGQDSPSGRDRRNSLDA